MLQIRPFAKVMLHSRGAHIGRIYHIHLFAKVLRIDVGCIYQIRLFANKWLSKIQKSAVDSPCYLEK